ncbi:MAG: hypothetical protein ABFS23_05305 [Pseudomonadota bacterium]
MKRTILTLAASIFATGVGADSIYGGFADGNPDLYPHSTKDTGVTAVQPAIGSDADIYHGFEVGNPDLFSPTGVTVHPSRGETADASDVYGGFAEDNPDLL